MPDDSDGGANIFDGSNGIAQHYRKTGKMEWYFCGDDAILQEPISVPRSSDAPDGDG